MPTTSIDGQPAQPTQPQPQQQPTQTPVTPQPNMQPQNAPAPQQPPAQAPQEGK
jgi:hypothetical protein